MSMRTIAISPALIHSPRWQAVGLVLEQNARDKLAHRYGLVQEVVSWYKGIDLFRQAELERMIQRKASLQDKRYHKTWLTALIAEGEKLLTEIGQTGLSRNKAGIKPADVDATVEELYDTQAEWYGSMSQKRRTRLLSQIFNGPQP